MYHISEEGLRKSLQNRGLISEEQKEAMKLMRDKNFEFANSDGFVREGLWESAQSSTVQSAVQSIATGLANLKRHKTTETVLMNTLKRQKFTPEEQEQAMQLMRDKNFDFKNKK